ncbi:sigma factor [Oceanobacillus damuensis]|uniref:sigma factor n=1 Tax=Oceanobacillus damuensis TaxID=937928 RepID=UPI00082EFDE9|nr:sigma factor [Oceanobacillus damuensis]
MKEIGKRVIKQVKKGDSRAFKKLVQHYHQSVYQICYIISGDKKDAEDLAKDIFLHVYYHIGDCQASTKKFSLWLFQKAVNLAQTQINEKNHSGMVPCFASEEKNKNDISFLLMNVSLKERLALNLKSSNHLSVQEISEVLEISNSDTLTYIWRGRESIREMIRQ